MLLNVTKAMKHMTKNRHIIVDIINMNIYHIIILV